MTRYRHTGSYDGWYLHEVRQSHRRRLVHRILTGIVQVALLLALGALFGLAIIDAIVTGPPVPLP
jgi:hypothetical protein